MAIQNNLNPIIRDIQKQYVRHRKMGRSREEAIELICIEYSDELQDIDDRCAVLIGLSFALCKKKELTEQIAMETLNEIRKVKSENVKDKEEYVDYADIERCLAEREMYGKEAIYKKTSIYIPDWKKGDIFSHELTYPAAEPLGIRGWIILLYKAGEYADAFGVYHQLVYVSLCPPNKIPSCSRDFEKQKFLCMMRMGDKEEYLAQITIKSKKAEKDYGFTKVGYFPDVLLPENYGGENPLTAMPLFGRVRKGDLWPGYEDQICRLYRQYGKSEKFS